MSLMSSIRPAASSPHSYKHRPKLNIRMSTIEEGRAYSPVYRATSSQLHLIPPPNGSFEAPPPLYLFPIAEFGTDTVKQVDQAQPAHRTMRRAAYLALWMLCLVGLVFGLAIGLTRRGKHSDM